MPWRRAFVVEHRIMIRLLFAALLVSILAIPASARLGPTCPGAGALCAKIPAAAGAGACSGSDAGCLIAVMGI